MNGRPADPDYHLDLWVIAAFVRTGTYHAWLPAGMSIGFAAYIALLFARL